jgi:hypothetical protein
MIPRTYAEWVVVLDKFGAGDDSVIVFMNQGALDWTNVVAERWTRQVTTCLNSRLQALSERLQTMLDRARGDHFAISNALLMTRRGLTPLRTFVRLPAFPEDVRTFLVSELDRWAAETQNSLEKHAATIRLDQGRLLKTIRDHALTVAIVESPGGSSVETSERTTVEPLKGRRVIL